MPNFISQSVPVSHKGLNGGLNSSAGPLYLQDNESSDLQNVDFDKFGSVLKRNGYATLNTAAISATPCDGLFWAEFTTAGTITRQAVTIFNSKIYKMDDLDGVWDDITGAAITSGTTFQFEMYNTKLFITNGIDTPREWVTGNTAGAAAVPTGLTTAKYVCQFNNYLFYANVTVSSTVYPTRIYWSALRDTQTWDSADWIEVSKDDGQEITGIKVLSDRLVIYKEKSIYNLYYTGDADIPFILPGGGKSNSAVGCIAPFSIQEVENGHVFLAPDGIYYYDGMNSYKISDKITSTIVGYAKGQFINAKSLVYKTKTRYMLSFAQSGQTTHTRVVVWDYFNNAFSVYVGLTVKAFATFYVSGNDERPYFADNVGFVYRMDTGTDDYPANVQTAINAYYYTNWKSYDDLCDQKGIPHVYIYYQSSNSILTFAYSYDFESKDQYSQTINFSSGTAVYGTAKYGTDVYASSGGAVTRRDLTGRGRVVRFKFANATKAETFTIDGFGAMAHLETQA
jgi:hypothetical protein